MTLDGTNKDVAHIFQEQEQERLDSINVSGGIDLELEKFRK